MRTLLRWLSPSGQEGRGSGAHRAAHLGRMNALNAMPDMNFGEALGYLLFDQGAITSPLDVGQAEVIRKPEVRADISNDGISEPAEEYVRYITRSGDPTWQFHDLTGVSPEELLWDVLRAVSKHQGAVKDY